MKKYLFILMVAVFGVYLWVTTAVAIPSLQLDISGGIYTPLSGHTDDTIVAQGNPFTLYAYLIPDGTALLNATYFLSMAVYPSIAQAGGNFGSFKFSGNTINVTSGMEYGTPSVPGKSLPTHSIFNTYFYEYDFQFDENQIQKQYNTQDRAVYGQSIPPDLSETKTMYVRSFVVDVTDLSTDYLIHFDLYNFFVRQNGNAGAGVNNAPFSHDAESDGGGQVPEPGILILLGIGMTAVGVASRWIRKI